MLGEIEAIVGFSKITAKPVSRWHRIFYGLLPFIQGTKVKFEITLTAQVNVEHNTYFLYTIQDSYGHQNRPDEFKIQPINQGQTRVIPTVDMPLYYSGDSFFTVSEKMSEKLMDMPQTVYIFHTTSRNTLFLALIAFIVTVVIATVTLVLGT